MDDSATSFLTSPAVARSRIPVLWASLILLAVLATWILGDLPWVLDGFRTPPDRAVPGTSSEGLSDVRLAIPLIAGRLTSLVAFTTIGAITATTLPLAFRDLPRALAVVSSGLAVAVTMFVVTFTSRASVSSHAADAFAGDQRVLDGLVAGVLLVAACTALLGCLGASQVGFLPLSVAVLVGQVPIWLSALNHDHGYHVWTYRIITVVFLAFAFAMSVRRSLWWTVLWPVAWLLLWTALPLQIATNLMQDELRPATGLNEHNLSRVFSDARLVFGDSWGKAHQDWWPIVLAALIALAWTLVRRRWTRVQGTPGPVA